MVYKAHNTILDRLVAIKVLAPHLTWDQEFVKRFLHEARAAARLKHPNIVTLYDVAQDVLGRFWDVFALEINGESVFWDGNKEPATAEQRHDLGWRRREVDLSPWRGQAVTVRFANWNSHSRRPGSELYNTWTYLDEVQVQP